MSLIPRTVLKAKKLAAEQSLPVSPVVAERLEALVLADEAYSLAAASAILRMERGLRMGGGVPLNRDELHER